MSDNEYGVGPNLPPPDSTGPSGPIKIPTAPSDKNTGYVRGGVRDGKLRNSGNPSAHRIGRKK